jgi:CoA:oxalate CoA-transferase
MSGPLDGMKVVDFSAMIAGPYCGRLLADMGAEVIKVEPPGGDLVRQRQPLREGEGGRHSAYYGNLNAGKQSLCVDLRKEAGRDLVRKLTAQADVVLENFRPGVMQRLGFDYPTLKPGNPRLVYCSISGFGQTGSEAGRASYAMVVHAMSGFDLANLGYQTDLERPLNTGIFVADILSGTFAFGAINAALVRRERSGEGEHIDLAMMDAMLGLMPYETAEAQFPATKKRFLYRPTRARDGFVVLAPISQGNFEDLARGAGREDWIGDPRFKNNLAREANWDALMQALDDWAADKSALECERAMSAAGVPCSRYLSVREAMALPYCDERGLFSEVRDAAGAFRTPNAPFRMTQAGNARPTRVAALGEDNRAIADRLGYAEDRILALQREGVLVSG